jgi:hypothetical protein
MAARIPTAVVAVGEAPNSSAVVPAVVPVADPDPEEERPRRGGRGGRAPVFPEYAPGKHYPTLIAKAFRISANTIRDILIEYSRHKDAASAYHKSVIMAEKLYRFLEVLVDTKTEEFRIRGYGSSPWRFAQINYFEWSQWDIFEMFTGEHRYRDDVDKLFFKEVSSETIADMRYVGKFFCARRGRITGFRKLKECWRHYVIVRRTQLYPSVLTDKILEKLTISFDYLISKMAMEYVIVQLR